MFPQLFLFCCIKKMIWLIRPKSSSTQTAPQKLTNFTSNKKTNSPYTTIAATNCEGNPPLEIDVKVPAERRKTALRHQGTGIEKGERTMSNRNNNQINVPEAKEAMNRFKMECANDEGVQNHIKKNNF